MSKVRIVMEENGKTRIFLDNMEITDRCYGFSLNQEGGEKPELTVTLSVTALDILLADGIGIKAEVSPPDAITYPMCCDILEMAEEAGKEFVREEIKRSDLSSLLEMSQNGKTGVKPFAQRIRREIFHKD